MTPEKIERNFEAAGFFITPGVTKLVMALCRDERERCARIADKYASECEPTERQRYAAEEIAAAIRKEKE
jgi:rRNA-processing protein FCF1